MTSASDVEYRPFRGEEEIKDVFQLIDNELSEPYGLFTYRYFVSTCPQYTLLAHVNGKLIGAIVGKESVKKSNGKIKGYIAMLVVLKEYRRLGIGRKLTIDLINKMKDTCSEVVLETEYDNESALRLYQSLGFVRTKRLYRYYLNGNEAYRLKIWFK